MLWLLLACLVLVIGRAMWLASFPFSTVSGEGASGSNGRKRAIPSGLRPSKPKRLNVRRIQQINSLPMLPRLATRPLTRASSADKRVRDFIPSASTVKCDGLPKTAGSSRLIPRRSPRDTGRSF